MRLLFKIRSLFRAFSYTETRCIECGLHGKRWEKNRDRQFSFVIWEFAIQSVDCSIFSDYRFFHKKLFRAKKNDKGSLF